MDYTKVISTVKKYAFGIVDILEELYTAINQGTEAIKTDVAGVKTDVAGVKTDVDGVQVGVDTALQSLTVLDGKVNPWDLQPNVIVRELNYADNGVILNVYGKGKLLCVGNMNTDGTCDIEVNMDGKKKLNINYRSNNHYGGCYTCQSYIRAKDGIKIITSFGDIMLNHKASKFIAGEGEFSYMNSDATFFTSYKPIVFDTKLTIEVKNKAYSGESTCLVAYILDPN